MPTVPEKLQISFHLFEQEPRDDSLASVLVNGCNHFDGSSWPQECQREDAKPTVP